MLRSIRGDGDEGRQQEFRIGGAAALPDRRRVGALLLIVGLVVTTLTTFFVTPARAALNDFTVPPGVTVTDGGENCNGVVPTPGSENTNKVLDPNAVQNLNPGGTASYLITFPSNVNNVGTFEIVDCVLLIGPGGAAKDYKQVLGEVTFTKVNNSVDFQLAFKFNIPATATNGDQICNVAKTTASPSKSPASNRKAGPACFVIGGSGRVEKHDKDTGAKIDGATFNIHDCVLGAGADPKLQPILVSLQNAAGQSIPGAPTPDPNTGLVSGNVSAAAIGFNGPSGSSCKVTETVAPAGYSLPPVNQRTVTVQIGANSQTIYVFDDAPIPTNLNLQKTADAATVNAGNPIGYTITISNGAGASTAHNVTINDTLPTGSGIVWTISPAKAGCAIAAGVLTCNFGDLAGGASQSVHVTSPTTAQSCAAYQNTASVTSTNGSAPNASATITVLCPGLNLTKTADAPTVNAGDQIGFTITVSNTAGAATATNVTVNDTLPTGNGVSWSIDPAKAGCGITGGNQLTCTFPSLAGGASQSVHVVSNTTKDSCKAYPNTASVTATIGTAPNATANTSVQCPAVTLTKTADAASVNAGDTIGFVIRVSNAGPGLAKNVNVSDTLPSGGGLNWTIAAGLNGAACNLAGNALTCPFGDIPSGQFRSVHVTSPTTAADCKVIPNTASATVGNGANPADATARVTVTCPALTLAKTADKPSVAAGQPIGFTVTVTNGANAGTAKAVKISDDLPAGTGVTWSIDPASPDANKCAIAAGKLTCDFGDLVAGASRSVHVTSPTTTASCKRYDNTAKLTSTNGSAPDASASTQVVCPSGGGEVVIPTTTTLPPPVVLPTSIVAPTTTTTTPPTTTTEPPTTTTVPTKVLGVELAKTGADLVRLIRLAGLTMVLGGILVFVGSRRPQPKRRRIL